jgi:hypothetical protein
MQFVGTERRKWKRWALENDAAMGCEKTPRVGIVGETGREGKTGRKKKTEVGTEQEKLFRGKEEIVKCDMKESVEIIEVKRDSCGGQ